MTSESKIAHYDRCLGLYDGFSTVIFASEHGLEVAPEITEFHEYIHKELSRSSVLGNLFRFFSLVTELGENTIPLEVMGEVQNLRSAVVQTTRVTQETIAIYLGLHFAYGIDKEAALASIEGLTDDYRALYDLGVIAFGSLDTIATDSLADDMRSILLALGMAALSPCVTPLPMPADIDLRDLSLFSSFVTSNSGDQRFRQILHVIDPPGVEGILQDSLNFARLHRQELEDREVHAAMEYSPLHGYVFNRIEAACPNIIVAKDRNSLRMWGHSLVESLKQACRREGSNCLDRVELAPISPENQSARVDFDGRFAHADDEYTDLPYDASIKTVHFSPVSSEFLPTLLRFHGTHPISVYAFAHPLGEQVSQAAMSGQQSFFLLCLVQTSREVAELATSKGIPLAPFSIVDTAANLQRLLQQLPLGLLVLRTPESAFSEVRELFASQPPGSSLYIILERSQVAYLTDLVARIPHCLVLLVSIPGARFVCLIDRTANEVFVSRATINTFVLLESELAETPDVEVMSDPATAKEFGVNVQELQSVITIMEGQK